MTSTTKLSLLNPYFMVINFIKCWILTVPGQDKYRLLGLLFFCFPLSASFSLLLFLLFSVSKYSRDMEILSSQKKKCLSNSALGTLVGSCFSWNFFRRSISSVYNPGTSLYTMF